MSTLKVNTLTDTAATKSVPIEDVVNGTARAWVNFNGTGTVAIRADYNVDSITDNGTGDYTVTFTNAMPDANYSVSGLQSISSIGGFTSMFTREDLTARSASLFRIRIADAGSTARDSEQVNLSIFR